MFHGMLRAAACVGLVFVMAACAGESAAPTTSTTDAQPTTTTTVAQPTTTTTSVATATTETPSLSIASSLANGTDVVVPVPWIATVTDKSGATVTDTSGTDPIERVEFGIDGVVLWTEHGEPFTFNNDTFLLVPSALTPGPHVLSIGAYTMSGEAATLDINVTSSRPAVPAELDGKSFEFEPVDPQVLVPGVWSMDFAPDGIIRLISPDGRPWTEAFEAAPDGAFSLYGPANWTMLENNRFNWFCPTNSVATMQWQFDGPNLTLSAGDTADPCLPRAALFTGTWTPTP